MDVAELKYSFDEGVKIVENYDLILQHNQIARRS